jgi:anthranilate 1,2-dioxygenase small subunit
MLSETQRRLIDDLQARYIRAIDDDRIEDWPGLFTDHCVYRIITRENLDAGMSLPLMECRGQGMLADRITGLRKINVYEPHRYTHQQSGLVVESFDGTTAVCRSSYLVVRTMGNGSMSIFSTGVYVDKIELRDGVAKFAERIVVQESRTVGTLLVIPL